MEFEDIINIMEFGDILKKRSSGMQQSRLYVTLRDRLISTKFNGVRSGQRVCFSSTIDGYMILIIVKYKLCLT